VAVDHPVGVPLGRLLGLPVSQARHHVVLQGAQRQKVRRKKALQWNSDVLRYPILVPKNPF
jgi:hypothetical protein